MIASVLSLVKDGFGLGFNAWAKLALPVMVVESLVEIVVINLVESWSSRTKGRNEE